MRLKVNKGKGGDEILPVIWQDNYISLLPGEKREVTASYRAQELGTAQPAVEVERLERGVANQSHVGADALVRPAEQSSASRR